MIVSLTGFMGCGKSSTGRALARLTGLPLVDLDQEIIKTGGKSISELFAEGGEEGFRSVERKTLQAVLASAPPGGLILALGGGTITDPQARSLILEQTRCVYLHSSLDKIYRNLDSKTDSRPLFRDKDEVEKLYNARLPIYRQAPCHICMDSLTPNQAAERIRRLIF